MRTTRPYGTVVNMTLIRRLVAALRRIRSRDVLAETITASLRAAR